MALSKRICERALAVGFDLAGIAPASPPQEHLHAYRQWLARGDHGEMAYLARPDRVARRADPTLILPGAHSVICVALNYYPGPPPERTSDSPRGRVSNYAWGQDYHDWMLPRLEELATFVTRETGAEVRHRAYVDTGPVLERALATQAGLGFVGKNTCLIHPRLGSWLFLGVLLVDLDLAPTQQILPPRCGSCTRCLEACPTGALASPYRLDARRCISYLTIELKGSIPPELRARMGDHVYGCDICQEVCPWQRFARPTKVRDFRDAKRQARPLLGKLLTLDEEGFRQRFWGSPVMRIGRGRLLRNTAVALGNSGDQQAVPLLSAALDDADVLVRSHAAWALGEIGGSEAGGALQLARSRETQGTARQELAAALERLAAGGW